MDKLVLALSIAYLLCLNLRFVHGATTITSCSQTPYPKVCNQFMNTNLPSTVDESKSEFHVLAHKVTMDQAIEAHRLISSMDMNLFNERAKLAWNDCLELYEDTINQLNRSISSNNPTDALTWLSASIANQQTCENGFKDFNLYSTLQYFPNMLSSFSKLLSNTLAINKALASSSTYSTRLHSKQIGGRRLLNSDGFPTWVSAADRRKLLESSESGPKADAVVAQDGSGNYKKISEAVASASGSGRYVIYVKDGVYKENVVIKKSNIMLIGDGIDKTIVTGGKNVQSGSTTIGSATVAISGDSFIARDITFENTAGPENHQAVALLSASDLSIFYRCSFKGYQDTLYVFSQRQFYRDCDIYGTQDFIFGDAVAVFQNCNIYVRKPMSGQKTFITAQSRQDPNENTGIIIHNSRVTAAGDLGSVETYLGRPWQKYSRTVFMKCDLGSLIDPAGWYPWDGDFALDTLYYAEYMNTGSGSDTSGRVKWKGYHVISSPAVAGEFTVRNFLAGGEWISGAGVPYVDGL
ncbi:pectinesterase [Quercus suber]|uniref:pectinesterase n=1 Tax=Quercus suber TaxID=58331 RepID=UPI000CE28E72|nr:pectinesterase-like [Quercus suber]POE99195.1 putative pectinesterase/pectinesterase inhibitor 6 [Quercus suber]